MTLHTRLARLERNRPAQPGDGLTLDLAPDLVARIEVAKAAGTFPQSLPDADLLAILHAHDAKRESHDRP